MISEKFYIQALKNGCRSDCIIENLTDKKQRTFKRINDNLGFNPKDLIKLNNKGCIA